jgi:membrane-bound lytic murein transglycosylase B
MNTSTLTNTEKTALKEQFKAAGTAILQKRIATIEQAMLSAQEAANNEEKSSAGDKHETARSMAQLTNEMNATQLDEARNDLSVLNSIGTALIHTEAGIGAVVITDQHVFYISLGLGVVDVAGKKVVFLSPNAPIALQLHRKQKGTHYTFNGKQVLINDIF